MPKTFQLYYELLMKQLTKGSQQPVDFSEEKMKEAIAEVKRKIKELGPDPENLDASFNGFCSRQPYPELCRQMKPDSEVIGENDTSRYAYAEQCRDEVFKNVEYRVRQTLEWRNAIDRLGIKNENNKIKRVNTGRWMGHLIKTDGTDESLRYNETIVALAALGDGVITRDEYLKIREEYHTKNDGVDKENARKAALSDYEGRAEFLYQEVDHAIEAGRERFGHYKDAALAVQTGDYSKFNGSMEEAFAVFHTNAEQLAMVGGNVFQDLERKFGYQPKKEEKDEILLRWQDYTLPANSFQSVAEQVSNPYFAIFDPFKYNRTCGQRESLIPSDEKVAVAGEQDKAAYSFMSDGVSYATVLNSGLENLLKQSALHAGNELKAERAGDYRIFSNGDRVAIVKIGRMTQDDVVTADDSEPEQLVIQGLKTTADGLYGRCSRWSKTFRTSREFENMRDSLTTVKDLVFNPDDPNKTMEEQVAEAAIAFEELRADAQHYLERKLKQHPDENWDGDYEAARIRFATDVLEFAEEKVRQARYYSLNQKTTAKRLLAEEETRQNPAWRNEERYAGMSPMQHKLEVEKEQQARIEEDERRAQQQAMQAQRDAERAYNLADGAQSAIGYDHLFEGLAAEAGEAAAAEAEVETFITGHKGPYDEQVQVMEQARNEGREEEWRQRVRDNDASMFEHARYIVAGYMIAEMLKGEQARLQNAGQNAGQNGGQEAKTPIRQLVNAGKTKELADVIIRTSHFQARFSERISNPAEMQDLMAGRISGNRPTCGECYKAGTEFLDNMALAKQAQAEKQAQEERQARAAQPGQNGQHDRAQDDQKKQEAQQGQMPLQGGQQEPENLNHINFIHEDEDDDEVEEVNRDGDKKNLADNIDGDNNKDDEDEKEEEINPQQKENPADNHLNRIMLNNMSRNVIPEIAEPGPISPEEFDQKLRECFKEVAKAEQKNGPAEMLLNHEIATNMRLYRRLSRINSPFIKKEVRNRAKESLADATLKYMLRTEAYPFVLTNAIERGQIYTLHELIKNNKDFQESFREFSLTQMDEALDDEEVFCKPVGDKILSMAQEAIKSAGYRTQMQRGADRKKLLSNHTIHTDQEMEDIDYFQKKIDRCLQASLKTMPHDWANVDRVPYDASPADHFLSEKIEHYTNYVDQFSKAHNSSEAKSSAEDALADSVIQYMMKQDPSMMDLEYAIERDQYETLHYMVLDSQLFKRERDHLNLRDAEKIHEYLSCKEIFIKPLGDKILSIMNSNLEYYQPKIANDKKADLFEQIKNDAYDAIGKSENALNSDDAATAKKYGMKALAGQTAYVLMNATDEDGKLPRHSVTAVTKRIYQTKQFQTALQEVDLTKPDELKKAINQGFGVKVVKAIIEAEKQKKQQDEGAGRMKAEQMKEQKQNLPNK